MDFVALLQSLDLFVGGTGPQPFRLGFHMADFQSWKRVGSGSVR